MTGRPPTEPAAPGVAGPGATPAAAGSDDRRWRLRHLPFPLAVSAGLALAAAVVGGLAAGRPGAAGAAAGVGLVTLGYVLSTLVVAWADSVSTPLVMPFGLMAYLVKVSMVAAVLGVAAATGWSGLVPMAWGVAAGVAGWTAAHIWWLTRRAARRSA